MQYCTDCKRLVEGPSCCYCGNRKLRVPLDADFCMVAELIYPEAAMLEELYGDNGIPCTARSIYGAGITVKLGSNLDRIRLYVPYNRYEEAEQLKQAFFDGAAELLPE